MVERQCFLQRFPWTCRAEAVGFKGPGQVEAVVGPYKLFDSSFRMLQGKEWLSDEKPVHLLCVAVSNSLFSGLFGCLFKIVCVTKKSILILDPLGKETLYERKVLRNWRNFLKLQGRDEHSAAWQAQTLPHEEQQDSSSCGLLILKFAELCLLEGSVQDVKTSESAISLDRIEIACALLTYRGKAEDYCVVCSMLEVNAEKSMIEMVQCDLCGRWAHFECAKYRKGLPTCVWGKMCGEKL
ncbi:uncharacterized protein LOC131348300 [Hemibagrus wyckioides]|uniref:uncharacterized protein LOC131348300 n=1 Tax=Hemibagrus wyckioides TaxID=337641 RepID=UPI00266B7135|nr:uncharacterized protein LOC131348300 [Hemibagrus wyckioides]